MEHVTLILLTHSHPNLRVARDHVYDVKMYRPLNWYCNITQPQNLVRHSVISLIAIYGMRECVISTRGCFRALFGLNNIEYSASIVKGLDYHY